MRIVSTYIADDGTRFTTEEECLEYEKKELPFTSLKDVLLFDGEGVEIKKKNFFVDMEQFLYIYIGSEDSLKIIKEINEDYGYSLPPTAGFWKFEYGENGGENFVSYEQHIDLIKKELNKYTNMNYIIECRFHNIE
jgi:hypothetical protein